MLTSEEPTPETVLVSGSTTLFFAQQGQKPHEPRLPKARLAKSRHIHPAYDRVKDILCRFARAIEEEEYHEQHPSL